MREITNRDMKAQISLDDSDRVRQINHFEQPWESSAETPLLAAIDYLRRTSGVLKVPPEEMENLQQPISFNDPRPQGIGYRLGQEKHLFDSTTIVFNQTYLNVPVWRAALTLTVKHNPNRVVMVTDTSEDGIAAVLPSPAKIEEHRQLFALAAAEQRLRVLGFEGRARTAALAEADDQPRTAAFVRRVLGRVAGVADREDARPDDARAIRGRFFVYRYDEGARIPRPPTEAETLPVLSLPPVAGSIAPGAWRLVSEVTFSLTTPEYGPLNWRALIDVETDSVLLLEPLVGGLNGLVFPRDPITSTGSSANGPGRSNAVLNPFRSSVELPNLDAPVNGVQTLKGRFAAIVDVNAPAIVGPKRPAGSVFDFDARTNDFAAVNAYYHVDRFFALVESLGFPVAAYFDNTTFPISVDHRDMGDIDLGKTINARCVGNGAGGIGYAGYALNDLTDTAHPIGRACDSRVHLHELGGHGVLYEHVDHPNFGFAHSAGDSMSAILHDPDSMLRGDPKERFRYAPWNPVNTRRFDREVADGWAWGGPGVIGSGTGDDRGYGSEQILCTTLFRVYRSIGGDSVDPGQRRFASRTMMYLILRAISTLTPATNPRNALGFANALMAVDLMNWPTEGVSGGAYNKVIRWSFEKQGLYQAPGAPTPVTAEGQPPDVDVYLDDGRRGEYGYQAEYWNNPSVWNRRAGDGGSIHQEPAVGVTNFAYVRIKNRGTRMAQNVRVRAFHHKAGGATVWPDDFEPLATAELVAGTLAARNAEEKVVGPFAWVPNADASGKDSLLMVVSADGDASNVNHVTAGESIPEWRLVPNDNNLGLRNVVPGSGESERRALPPSRREAGPASRTEQLFRALGFSGPVPPNVRVKGLTFQVEIADLSSVLDVAAAAAPRAEAAEEARWGIRRHAAIATAAMERLRSPRARAAIVRILDESGEISLGEAAKWADKIKGSNPPNDPATQRFRGDPRNQKNSTWHYVNLPLDLDGYDRQRHPEFTRADDVVQMILVCVEALRVPGPRARFEEITALRWLTHLMGDLHQPVHVGCGYIADARTNGARLVTSPADALGLPNDRGGGELALPIGGNLHGYWDSRLGPDVVPDVMEATSDAALVRELVNARVAPAADETTDAEGQVVSCANSTLAAAREAYRSIRITGYQPGGDGDYPVEWEGETAYRARCAPIVSARMAAAAANLAGLLDSIWP